MSKQTKDKKETTAQAVTAATAANVQTPENKASKIANGILTVAAQRPAEKLGNIANGLHNAYGACKAALAIAAYCEACRLLKVAPHSKNQRACNLGALALALGGVGYCHATGKPLSGEFRKQRGMSGYVCIRILGTWGAKYLPTGAKYGITQSVIPTMREVYNRFGKANTLPKDANSDTVYATVHSALQSHYAGITS